MYKPVILLKKEKAMKKVNHYEEVIIEKAHNLKNKYPSIKNVKYKVMGHSQKLDSIKLKLVLDKKTLYVSSMAHRNFPKMIKQVFAKADSTIRQNLCQKAKPKNQRISLRNYGGLNESTA